MANLFPLLALLCFLHLCAAAIYYVKPIQLRNTTCPRDHEHTCLTLDEYTVSSKRYFTSNTVFLFLSGRHELSSSFNVSDIYNLTFKPYIEGGSVVVHPLVCHPYAPVTMRFEGVSDVAIAELTLNGVSFAFEKSSDISLTRLVVSIDPNVAYDPNNPAAISSTQSSISFTGCEFLELQNTAILSTSSEIVLQSHSYFHVNATAISSFGNSTLVLRGDAVFLGLMQRSGISLYDCSVFISEGNVTFSTWQGGAISGGGNSTLFLNGIITFTDNENIHSLAPNGGAITLNGSSSAFIVGVASFTENVAHIGGGGAIALHGRCRLVINGTVKFTFNTGINGGAILLSGSSTLVLNGDVTFLGNIAQTAGGAVALNDSCSLILNGIVTFSGNEGVMGGAILLSGRSTVILDGNIIFFENRGGAITTVGDSSVILQGHVSFIKNSASNGGAMALMGNRTIYFPKPDATLITFTNNIAYDNGGALYFLTPSDPYNVPQCVFFFDHLPSNPLFNFKDNTAGQGGDAIFGAYFELGCVTPSGKLYIPHYFQSILNNISLFSPSFTEDLSLISSDPLRLCFCKDHGPDCLLANLLYSVYPGELFDVPSVVVGDMQGLVNSTVIATIDGSPAYPELGDSQNIQTFQSRKCANLTYSIIINVTDYQSYMIALTASNKPQLVGVTILPCPVGFALSSEKFCDCAQALLDIGTISCNISQMSIQRQGTVWIGAVQQNTYQISLVYGKICPFSYCIRDKVSISLVNQTYLDQDIQCSDERSGILCGGCRTNFSLALGSNRCLPGCTNNSLSLIIAFAAAGIALVFFIKILNLTLSQGTLNGLIFYANIIGAQPTFVFPVGGSPAS